MGQVPWLDRLLYKNPVSAFFQNTAGSKILTMVNQYIKEKQEQKPTIRNESCKLDMLSHFLHIQETNPNIPSKYAFISISSDQDLTNSGNQRVQSMDLCKCESRLGFYSKCHADHALSAIETPRLHESIAERIIPNHC